MSATPASDLAVTARLRRGTFELDLDLHVEAGTTVALLGPNGAGKSTTFGLVAGLDELGDLGDHGRNGDGDESGSASVCVRLGERVLTDTSSGTFVLAEQRRVGVVFQDHLLFPHLSVVDNIAFGPRSAGRSRSASRQIADEWIDRFDLGAFRDRRPTELSGGQAQRVAIARSLASSPDLLLLDEPLAALDVESRRDLRRAMRRHLDDLTGPRLLVTHDPSDAFVLADEIVVIEHGRLTQRGTPAEIRRRPNTPYVAALGGTNLIAGTATGGTVTLDEHRHVLTVADTAVGGPVMLTMHPRSVSLHPHRPDGSQRNTWQTTVDLVEPMGDTVRITLGSPLPVSADVTPGAVDALGLAPGSIVWAAVKATEIAVDPA